MVYVVKEHSQLKGRTDNSDSLQTIVTFGSLVYAVKLENHQMMLGYMLPTIHPLQKTSLPESSRRAQMSIPCHQRLFPSTQYIIPYSLMAYCVGFTRRHLLICRWKTGCRNPTLDPYPNLDVCISYFILLSVVQPLTDRGRLNVNAVTPRS